MESKASIKRYNLSRLVTEYQIDPIHAFRLQQLAKSLHRYHEHDCNYGLTGRQEKRERHTWAQVETIARYYNLCVQEQGDPRGWPIIISKQSIEQSRSDYDRVCPF